MPLKVAMVGPFSEQLTEGGVEHHVYYLAENLEKRGVGVERWSWKIPRDTAKIRRMSLLKIDDVIHKSDADIIHLHSTATAAAFLANLKDPKKKFVSTIHAFFHSELEQSLRMKIISTTLSYPYCETLKRIRNNIAVSSFVKREALDLGISVRAIIGNGVPLENMKDVKPNDELKSDVLLVARLSKQKGVLDFITAFSNSGLKATLIGYGDERMEERVTEECAAGGITAIIRPERKVVLSAMKSTQVFAFPSKRETFGITALEAMALGKPVVVYKTAEGPLDFIRNDYNGLVIENTPAALRKGAERVLKDKNLQETLSINALNTAKRYDWPNIAKKVEEFYYDVLAK